MRDTLLTPPPPTPKPAGPPVTVDVAFTDTSAQSLSFSLDHARITPLASRFVDLPASDGHTGSRLELHVIGSSHQVVLSAGGTDAFIETFACLGEGARPEWSTTHRSEGLWADFTSHRFRCELNEVAGSFADAAAEVVERSSAHAHHLVADFPGQPGAITALALTGSGRDRVVWQTWHCYPQHAQIVHSRSELRRRP